MDKIRENAFGIGVGILSLGAAILFYFLVLGRMFAQFGDSTGSVHQDLTGVNRRLESYKSKTINPVLPTREYVEAMKKYKGDLDSSLERAEEIYVEKSKRFNDPFEAFIGIKPALADFQAAFTTDVEKLRDTYLEAFPRKPPEDPNKPPEDILPGQDKRVFENDAQMLEGTKHFWILEEIFKALHQHQLGGLQSITFPPPAARGGQAEPAPPQYKVMRAGVKVSLPMDRIEPLLSTLYQGEKVSFELETLTIERDPETIIQELVLQKEYEKPEDAAKDSLPGAEPPVNAEITLRAIEWVGFPKEPDPKAKK